MGRLPGGRLGTAKATRCTFEAAGGSGLGPRATSMAYGFRMSFDVQYSPTALSSGSLKIWR